MPGLFDGLGYSPPQGSVRSEVKQTAVTRKLVTGGESGGIEAGVRELQEPVAPHPMCSDAGAESGDREADA